MRNIQLDEGQIDPLIEVLARTVDEARGFLGARPHATMGPEGTIPPQLLGPVLDIARYRLCSRLAVGPLSDMLLSEAREREYQDAIRILRDTAKGVFSVESPEVRSEPLSSVPSPRITPRPGLNGRSLE